MHARTHTHSSHTHTSTHPHRHVCMYVCVQPCVCVCAAMRVCVPPQRSPLCPQPVKPLPVSCTALVSECSPSHTLCGPRWVSQSLQWHSKSNKEGKGIKSKSTDYCPCGQTVHSNQATVADKTRKGIEMKKETQTINSSRSMLPSSQDKSSLRHLINLASKKYPTHHYIWSWDTNMVP